MMFKSVFAKYQAAFMTIITFGFVVLLVIVTTLVGNYSVEAKESLMESTASLAETELEHIIRVSPPDPLDEILTAYGKKELRTMLSELGSEEELHILVADSHGTVLLAADDGGAFAEGDVVPVWRKALEQEVYTGTDVMLQSGEEAMVCSHVLQMNGDKAGFVLVYSFSPHRGTVLSELTKTIVASALLVLLAAMIAAFFITDRTIGPLHEMSAAAKRFAAGRFDVRVRVRGRDEVAELARAFNSMAESLEGLENMRNTFIANVSHDLRSPMTTIAGFIDGIREGVIPKEETDHYLEIISIEVHRLSRLVASLLDLSRIQAGDRKFVMKPFDMCELARLALFSFEQRIEKKQLQVAFDCDRDRMYVNADHDAIYQVFYNICHNAVKFSRDGGALRVSIKEAKDKKLRISVYNEGEGIPEEDRAMVFERFYKRDKSRGLDKSGVGLGLFISKTIISAHGETIGVTGQEGQNCEFYFTLPSAPASHPTQERARHEDA